MATFFAARKQPRRIIERLMSSISTVAHCVEQLRAVDLEVVGLELDRAAGALALDRVHQRAAAGRAGTGRRTRTASCRRCGRRRRRGGRVSCAAEAVLLQVGEDVVQRLLADLADAARRQLERSPFLLDVAGLLEQLAELLELLQRLRRVVAEQAAQLLRVDARRGRPCRRRRGAALELGPSPAGRPSAASLPRSDSGSSPRKGYARRMSPIGTSCSRFIASSASSSAAAGPAAAASIISCSCRRCSRRHAVQQRLHLRPSAAAAARSARPGSRRRREEVAVLLHELSKSGSAALGASRSIWFRSRSICFMRLHVLGRHVLHRLLHALEGRLHHLLLEHLQQLLELLPGLGVHEVVVAQLLDLPGRSSGSWSS